MLYKEEDRPTFLSPDELRAIRSHCESSGAEDVLEIGTYCGAATKALLRGSSGLVISIDPLYHPSIKVQVQQNWIDQLSEQFPDRLIFIPAPAYQVILHRKFSVLMIDGDHHPSSVIADLRRFVPRLKSGGSIILDDVNDQGVGDMWEYYRRIDTGHRWESLKRGKLEIWRKHLP